MDLKLLEHEEELTKSDIEAVYDIVHSTAFRRALAIELRRLTARDTLTGKNLEKPLELARISGEITGGKQVIERLLAYGIKEEEE